MIEYKKDIEFLDAENHRARIHVEITKRNGYAEFTASGSFLGSFGQCLDKIKPANNAQRLLIGLWKDYHLKNVEKLPDNVKFWPDFTGHLEGIIAEIEKKESERKAGAEEKSGDDAILAKMEEEGIDEDQFEAVKAYMEAGISDSLEDFEESYAGKFGSDEQFAQNIAEELGMIDDSAKWPNNCIDWEHASRELMCDYTESSGHYFRNI